MVCSSGFGAGGCAGEGGDAFNAGDLHFVVDLCRAYVEGTAEDEREAEHVVDLVRVVRTACRDDRIGRGFAGEVRQDFWCRVCQCKDDRAGRHFLDHLGFQNTRTRQAEEEVRAFDHLVQSTQVRGLSVGFFLRGHFFSAAFIDQTRDVAEPYVFTLYAKFQEHVEAGNTCRAAACRDDLNVFEFLACDVQRVGGSSTHNNRGAVLVVVEHRNVHAFAADLFDDEAIRRFDVFEVDRTKGRFERTDNLGQFVRVGFVQFDVETVDVRELLKENGLAFHNGLGRQGTDIAKAQNCRAVCHHTNKVAARGISACCVRVGLDLEAGFGHAGAVGAGKVTSVCQRFGCADFQFPRFRELVVVQRCLTQVVLALVGHVVIPF